MRMEVAELKVMWTRLNESLLTVRVSTDSTPVLREAICSLDGQVKDLAERVRLELCGKRRKKERLRWPL